MSKRRREKNRRNPGGLKGQHGAKERTGKRGLPKFILPIAGLVVVAVAVMIFLPWSSELDRADVERAERGTPNSTSSSPETLNSEALVDSAVVPLGDSRPAPEVDDASQDGWDTEVLSEMAGKQVKEFAKLLSHPDKLTVDKLTVEKLTPLVTDDFSCDSLRPANLRTAFDDGAIQVLRPDHSLTELRLPSHGLHHGVVGFVEASRAMADTFSKSTDIETAVKVFRIDVSPAKGSPAKGTEGTFLTLQYFAISGRSESGMIEQNVTWEIRWQKADGGGPPRMISLLLKAFEEVTTRHSAGSLFTDCTASVLLKTPFYRRQILRGLNHWLDRGQQRRYTYNLGTAGIAVGDVNGDGLEDFYFCQEQGLPNGLFLQQPDGTVNEVAASWGVDWLHDSRSALLVDLDNDGDQDLAVAFLGGVVIAENEAAEDNGGQRFHVRTVVPCNDDLMSLSAVDYDSDGDLDLFVCGYHVNQKFGGSQAGLIPTEQGNFVYHDANTGGKNSLLRNEGQWSFSDVSEEVGILDGDSHQFSFAGSWDDYDNDGDQDLYVANDYGRDKLYRNDGGFFTEVSDTSKVENGATGMSISWGDYDRDGWMDAYVSNMYSSAGNRVAFQDKFKADAPDEFRRRMQRFARGNTLLKNARDRTFQHVSAEAGVEVGRWAWGSNFVDLNNDGWEDLVVANGYITNEDTGDL